MVVNSRPSLLIPSVGRMTDPLTTTVATVEVLIDQPLYAMHRQMTIAQLVLHHIPLISLVSLVYPVNLRALFSMKWVPHWGKHPGTPLVPLG